MPDALKDNLKPRVCVHHRHPHPCPHPNPHTNTLILMRMIFIPIRETIRLNQRVSLQLLELRDFCLSLAATRAALHHAAAALFHLWAHTSCWLILTAYAPVRSDPFHIAELGLQSTDSVPTKKSRLREDEDADEAESELISPQPQVSQDISAPSTSLDASDPTPIESPKSDSLCSSRVSLPPAAHASDLVDVRPYSSLHVVSLLLSWFSQLPQPVKYFSDARRGVLQLPPIECCYAKHRHVR